MSKAMFAAALAAMVLEAGSAAGGSVSGAITNPEKCRGVQVIQRRIRNKRVDPVAVNCAFDAATGTFASPDLKTGTYDLRILMEGGMLEGVNLRVEVPDGETPGDLTEADRAAVIEQVAKLNAIGTYMNTHRAVHVRGNASRVAVLVEQIRHEQAYGRPKGEITWRVDIWQYENHTGAWVRPRGSRGRDVTLWRLRIPADMPSGKFRDSVLLFDPGIGGLDVSAEKSVEGLAVALPEPDPSLGKTPGSVARQIEEDRKKNPDRYD